VHGHSQFEVVGEGPPRFHSFALSETVVLRAMSSACDVTNPWGETVEEPTSTSVEIWSHRTSLNVTWISAKATSNYAKVC